jgi:hypothetical protein
MDFGKKHQVPPPLDFQPVCIYDPSKQFYQFIAKKSNFPLMQIILKQNLEFSNHRSFWNITCKHCLLNLNDFQWICQSIKNQHFDK